MVFCNYIVQVRGTDSFLVHSTKQQLDSKISGTEIAYKLSLQNDKKIEKINSFFSVKNGGSMSSSVGGTKN